jgi:hypothetical protein
MNEQMLAWCERRLKAHFKVNWHFTVDDLRVKLKTLYPKIAPLG